MSEISYELIAGCGFGLEAVVRREFSAMGIEATIGEPGRVHFRGDEATICLANLWLRTADRVLIRVAEIPAADFDALFENTRAVDWGRFLPADAKFPVTGHSVSSTLKSVPACQRTVKRAVVDALRRDHGVNELSESGPEYEVHVAILKDVATLTIDTTGPSLHRRGYRVHTSKTAMKETLAAAMVLLSRWQPDRPLMDPFCGSGTIAIEAAMIGRRIAPGRDRTFAFQAWPSVSDDQWRDAKQSALEQELPKLDERIIASDIDERILRTARDDSFRAGVSDDIHFHAKAFADVTSKRRFGYLVTQMPLEPSFHNHWEPEALFRSIPDVLRKLPTWSHAILSDYPPLEEAFGRVADRRRKLYCDRIACTLYQFHGPKPVTNEIAAEPGVDATPVKPHVHASGSAAFGELPPKANEQAELFTSRLVKRSKHLRRWPSRRGITCYRLYERDIPEIPLVVDRYEDYLHISEYERPHDRDPAQHGNWLDLMAATAGKALDIPVKNVFLKRRGRQRGKTQHGKVDDAKELIEVNEGGLKFLVNLSDYVDTGLFLDHRITRQTVRESATGKRFLNLFAYTGSFTVYAASGGAATTTTVDLSKNYLDWAWQNLRLNGLSGNQHKFVPGDVGEFVRQHAPGEHYDLVVCDPPTFSNSKRTEQDWDVQHDSMKLLVDLMPLLSPGGVIYFSNNFRRFKFDESAIPATEIRELSKHTVPEDFRNRRIHRCWRITK